MGEAIVHTFSLSDWEIIAPSREQLDVTNKKQIAICLGMDPVDLLVYAVGITRDVRLLQLGENEWNDVFAVNFQGAVDCVGAVLPEMIARGRGHIVFISSYSALHPPLGQVAYATAKAALLGLTSSLAREHGHQGIRVNAILPGFMETRMTASVSAERKKKVLTDHTLGRLNTPNTVAKFIKFLHEEMSETSGQVFQLDSRIP